MSEKKEPSRTPIRDLGKYVLTDRISTRFTSSNEATLQGIGDDASVACFREALTVSAQKMSLEGVDFDLSYFPLKFIGYKTAVHAMGQVMAMNAHPAPIACQHRCFPAFFRGGHGGAVHGQLRLRGCTGRMSPLLISSLPIRD